MTATKRIVILGSTGSIGVQALEVIEASEELELVALSAQSKWQTLLEQARRHDVTRVALSRRVGGGGRRPPPGRRARSRPAPRASSS